MGIDAGRFAISPDDLRRRLDPTELPFDSTVEIEPLGGTIGQPRALDAIEFGLEVAAPGYNLFVAGAPGSGRTGTIRDHLERVARLRPRPDDIVYVYNFDQPDRPNAIGLPAGRGSELEKDMEEFLAAASGRSRGRSRARTTNAGVGRSRARSAGGERS